MATATLRPNGTVGTNGSPRVVNAASHHEATSDNVDTTYSDLSTTSGVFGHVRLGFNSVTIPANAQIRSVTPRLRHNNRNGVVAGNRFALGSIYGVDFPAELANSAVYYVFPYMFDQTGVARTTRPDGQAWTQADINTLALAAETQGNPVWSVTAAYIDVTYNQVPTVTATGPSGTQSSTRPTATWTYSDPEGDPQERFRVRGFTAAQYSAAGFDPNITAPAFDSGEVFSSATSWQVNTDLLNGTNYRVFIQAADAGSNGRYSIMSAAGPYMTFVVGLTAPAVPEIASVVADPALSRHTLTLVDRQNILSDDQANFETSQSWSMPPGGNATLASADLTGLTPTAFDGTKVLRVTANAPGWAFAASSSAGNAVIPGRKYSALAMYLSPPAISGSRSVQTWIRWYDAVGAHILTAAGPAMTVAHDNTWRAVPVTGVAPANAASAAVQVSFLATAAADYFYVDAVALVPYALNLLANPIFELDTNNDGLGDSWATYNWNGSDPGAVYSLQPAPAYVLGGSVSQQIGWGVNTGWKGISQANLNLKAGQQYTASAWVRLDNGGEAQVMVDPSAPLVSLQPKTWTQLTHTFTAAADDLNAFFYVRSSQPGANTMWIGQAQFELGGSASAPVLNQRPWPRGGFISAQRFEVQRSDDAGATWKSLPRIILNPAEYAPGDVDASGGININDVRQSITAFDYEAPRLTTPLYRVRSSGKISGNNIASSWSIRVLAPSLPATGWILKSLTDPSFNMGLRIDWASFTEDEPIDSGVFEPLDADETVVIQGRTRGKTLSMGLRFMDGPTFDSFAGLRRRKESLLLQDPNGRQWFVRMVGGRKANEWKYSGGVMVRTLTMQLQEVSV